MYGALCFCLGLAMYLVGVLLVFPRYLLDLREWLDPVAEWLVWYSGVPIVVGIALALVDLLYFHPRKKPDRAGSLQTDRSPEGDRRADRLQ